MKTTANITAGLLFALAVNAQAAIIATYTEDFFTPGTGGSANQSLSEISPGYWDGNYGSSASSYTRTTNNSANSPVASGTGDFLFIATTASETLNVPVFVRVTDLSAGPAYQFESVQFGLDNNSGTENVRITIQIGGTWYVTNTQYNETATAFEIQSTAGSTWSALNFTAGTSMSYVNSPTALPTTGTITGVGIYDESRSDTIRLDNLSIRINTDIVPEPSTAMLFGAAGFLVLLRRRR